MENLTKMEERRKCRYCGKKYATMKITDLINIVSVPICAPCHKKTRARSGLN